MNSGKFSRAKVREKSQEKEIKTKYLEGSPVFEREPGRYRVQRNERHLVHIKLYIGARFSQETGEEIAQYNVQKFNVQDFKNFEEKVTRLGYKYCFLHKPVGFKSKFEV